MAEGLVNYTRLDDSAEKIIHTRGYPMCPDDEVWVADAEKSTAARGSWTPDDARAVHFPYITKPAAQCQRL